MKILLYTQETCCGGSSRLLLNLARYLAHKHDVTLSFPGEINPGGLSLFNYFSDIPKVPEKHLIEHGYKFDVAIFHLPYRIDNEIQINCSRKIAVVMEIPSRNPIVINNSNMHEFDNLIYFSDNQISHLDKAAGKRKFVKLKIINNIDYQPSYNKTHNVGCVGSHDKHNLGDILRILRTSKAINKLILYCSYRPSARKLGIRAHIWEKIFDRLGKIDFRGIEVDAQRIYASFDCLLHTPSQSNGTSVVVSDSLASGKQVMLSPLPEFKQTYRGVEGVFFLDEIKYNLTSIMRSYNFEIYKRTLENYRNIYDR
jgi:hypothetical protein